MIGTMVDAFKGKQLIVELVNGHEVPAYPGGKIHEHCIRLLLRDRVRIEVSGYDVSQGRMAYRYACGPGTADALGAAAEVANDRR